MLLEKKILSSVNSAAAKGASLKRIVTDNIKEWPNKLGVIAKNEVNYFSRDRIINIKDFNAPFNQPGPPPGMSRGQFLREKYASVLLSGEDLVDNIKKRGSFPGFVN